MGGFRNALLVLVLTVLFVATVPTSDIGSYLNYAPKSYIV
jgi:hypothetical protein